MNPDYRGINSFALKVLHRVAEYPGRDFNPLFLPETEGEAERSFLQALEDEIRLRHRELCLRCETPVSLMGDEDLCSGLYDGTDVLILVEICLDALPAGFEQRFPLLINQCLLQNRQVVCLTGTSMEMLRERLSRLFPIPEKALFLDIALEPERESAI